MDDNIERFITDVKGGIAETLVTMLFRRSGYAVKLHGKWKAADFNPDPRMKLWEGDGSPYPATNHPDLIISSRGRKELVEIKYRREGKLYRHLKSNHLLKEQCIQWGDVGAPLSVVIINQECAPYITVLKAPYFSKTGWFISRIPIMEAGWSLKQDIYDECIRLLEAGLFNGVSSTS